MLQNFKTDIIYYKTATDFELEFNLCGCCRMRLFNDKCNDKKSMLLALSKAVSRSRVIIVTAPLFSEDNITETVATAIGSKTETVNNSEFNIASNTEIKIIKDSLPLVTEDGIFGGCIIESGPQSLILLTDNKTVRKTVMKSLIHTYIKDIAMGEDDSELELITDDDEDAEDGEQVQGEEAEASDDGLILDDGQEEAENEQDIEDISSGVELFTDTTSAKKDDNDEDGYYYNDDSYYTDEQKENPSNFNIWMLIISIIILLSLAVLCYCIFYVPTKQGISPSAYLKDVFDTMFK